MQTALRFVAAVVGTLALAGLAPAAAEDARDGEKLLGQIKQAVQAGDWKPAHELLRKLQGALPHGSPPGFEWNSFSSHLQDAAVYADDQESQKRGRAKAAEISSSATPRPASR